MSASVVMLGMAVATASAAILNVPAEYPGIQAAIEAAQTGDTVVVAPGVYYETINFGGKDIVVTSSDPNDPKVVGYSIINADGDGSVVTFENGETPAAKLIGFTITGGFGTVDDILGAPYRTFWGGGIYCKNASPTIARNVIVNNQCPVEITGNDVAQIMLSYGGGIGCIQSSAVITGNTIRGNSAYLGGGIMTYLGNARIENNVICENSAIAGVGVTLVEGQLLNNTIVANNAIDMGVGEVPGGAVYAVFDPSFQDSRVSNNIISDSTTGGILLETAVPAGAITFNDVWGNTPGDYCVMSNTGAMIYDGQASLTGIAGNLSADPLFVDPLNRNYHLTFESPCVNAGDPDFVMTPGQKDIDFEDRVYGLRLDIGADEYVGYVKPVAFAGYDHHVLEPLQAVTLDGSDSFFYDPCGLRMFRWSQVSGPAVDLDDPNAMRPTFTPPSLGEYVFELVVHDDRYGSEPDGVLVLVAGNQPPVADAGPDGMWQAPGFVTLNGLGSHDPDRIDRLTYQWRQVEGPAVDLQNADSATPSFAVDAEGQWAFELVVGDGFAQSEPSRVRCAAVSVTVATSNVAVPLPQAGAAYHVDISGTRIVYTMPGTMAYELRLVCTDLMTKKAEVFFEGGTNIQPRIDGDLAVWFGGVSYQGNSGTETTSVFVHNLATGAQQALRTRSDSSSFSHPAVSGNQVVWLQQLNLQRGAADWSTTPFDICGADLSQFNKPVYFTVATGVGRHELFAFGTFVSDFDDVVDISGNTVVWEADGDIYAADISDLNDIRIVPVCQHPARQYDPAISGRFVVWTDERTDGGDIYGADLTDLANIREFAVVSGRGAQQQPTIDGPLVAYLDGVAGRGSVKVACVTRDHGGLNVAFPDSYTGFTPALDGRTVVWLADNYAQIRGLSVGFGYSISDGRVQNARTGKHYDYMQHAITDADSGDTLIAAAGLYEEKFDFAGKPVTVRSNDPNDPAVVAATVFRSGGSVVSLVQGETGASALAGLTFTGGSQGIYIYGASPTITRCVVTGNVGGGVRLLGGSNPTLTNCQIVANGGAGVDLSSPASESRAPKQAQVTILNSLIAANRGQGVCSGKPTLINCTVVENQLEGVAALMPVVVNCIVCFNDQAGDKTQIDSTRGTVSYSDVEGGWPGDGNLDADPQFVALGRWIAPAGSAEIGAFDSRAVWTPGDYHLKSQGWRWDAVTATWVSDDATSPCIDAGDPASELLDEPRTAPGDPVGPVINERIDMGVYGGTAEASLAPTNQ
jgi:beta propeller repeat protein/parallel beta-helix repeat protein